MNAIRKIVSVLALGAALAAAGGEVYSDFAGSLVLPQGGAAMRRLGGGVARVGAYFDDYTALEGEIGLYEDVCELGARVVWHLANWEEFGLLFGYERFDPFLTLGGRGYTRELAGPSAGFGALYYLTDSWALRFDSDATLGLGRGTAALYSFSLGARYSF